MKDIHEHISYQREYFEKNDKKTMQPRHSAYLARQIERVIQAGRLSTTERILDIGCGIGKYTLQLWEKGYYRVEGLDIASGLLEQFAKHNRNIPLHCADIANPPPDLSGKFDAAVGFFALHHMFDLDQSFRGVAQVLKKGGRVLFLEPNPYNILYYLQIFFTSKMTWEGDKGILRMRRRMVFSAMERAGLIHCSLQRSGFFPPFLANMPGAIAVEKWLEKIPLWKIALPFQLFMAKKRTSDAHPLDV